jgi:hypothetical protein
MAAMRAAYLNLAQKKNDVRPSSDDPGLTNRAARAFPPPLALLRLDETVAATGPFLLLLALGPRGPSGGRRTNA